MPRLLLHTREKRPICPGQTARILEADAVDRSGVAVDPTRPASVHFWTGATSDHFSLIPQSTSVTYLAGPAARLAAPCATRPWSCRGVRATETRRCRRHHLRVRPATPLPPLSRSHLSRGLSDSRLAPVRLWGRGPCARCALAIGVHRRAPCEQNPLKKCALGVHRRGACKQAA